MDQIRAPVLEIRTPGCRAIDVALDGDICRQPTPLRLRVDRAALTVLSEPDDVEPEDDQSKARRDT